MKPLYTSVTMKKLTVSWDKYFLMILKKKGDKCIQMHYIGKSYVKHCIQVWRWKKIWSLWKKVWQVYTMHYIGKSYETTVYKCDDENIDRFLGQIFSDDSEKKAWQVYTNAFHREKLCKHCIQVWRWKKI